MKNNNFNFKKLYKHLSIVLVVIFLLSIITGGTYSSDSVIDQVRNILKANYVDELPDSVLNQPTVDGIIKEINKTDTHTEYFTASQYTDFQNSINNTFSGIGVQVEMVSDGVQIITVFDGSPAQEAKLKPGDVIMMADNHILSGAPQDVALGYIKGPEGTSVKLKVKRGNALLSFNITRKQINAPTVNGEILDKHIGYIQLVSFGEDTAAKFGEMVNKDESNKVDSYIVDLRYNGGGYLTTALDIAGYFIGNNLALITRSRQEGKLEQNAVPHNTIINKPVIFLINEYSASASEILSGAVKDYNKAYFIGVRSYGKGSVQSPQLLSNNDVLKYTIEKFFSPKDHTIDKVGITPEMNVPDDIDSMRVAELILDTPKLAKSNKGYVKISINSKTVISKISKLDSPLYWQSYKQLITLATTGGAISLGTDKGWTAVSKANLKDLANMYYPNYKIQSKINNVTTDSAITLKFNAKMLRSSLNSKNIELIDTSTGDRVPIALKVKTDKEVVAAPTQKFTMNKKYYLVVNPNTLKSDKKALGYGMLDEISTAK